MVEMWLNVASTVLASVVKKIITTAENTAGWYTCSVNGEAIRNNFVSE